jgi:hypothetical protein
MKSFTRFVILTGASLVVGCATQAPATSTAAGGGHEGATAAATAAPPTPSAAPQSPNAQPQPASLNSQSASAPPKDDSLMSGYDRVIVQGHPVYCRREATPGSRVTSRVCRTREELEAEQAAAKQYIDSAQRSAGVSDTGQPAGPY